MPTTVIETEEITTIVVTEEITSVIEDISIGPQGPPGPKGEKGEFGGIAPPNDGLLYGRDSIDWVEIANEITSVISALDLGGQRVVIINNNGKAEYADNLTLAHINKVIGITKHSCVQDEIVKIQTSGIYEDSGWHWNLGSSIYLSVSGMLTQTLPTSGFILNIAKPISATKILISINNPIRLED